jgi:NAD(P)-dependent dehydrogenase (short-subunit alcohol dehydrogenase family)
VSTWLAGKAVVITGSGRGLGRAFAAAVAAEGASVVVNDLDGDVAEATVAELSQAGAEAVAHVGSVASWDGAAELIETCVSSFGRIDGLVNNAGVFYTRSPLQEREQDLRGIVEANVLGTMFAGVHAIQAMAGRGGGGAIVNIGSEAMRGYSSMGAYAATKGAVASMTYAWSHHLEETGVRVNAVAPNAQTRMTPRGPDGRPLPRPEAASVAPLVVYLLSDASAGINGKLIKFNGTRLVPMVPTAPAEEAQVREGWTVGEIAAACDGPLAALLHSDTGPAAPAAAAAADHVRDDHQPPRQIEKQPNIR